MRNRTSTSRSRGRGRDDTRRTRKSRREYSGLKKDQIKKRQAQKGGMFDSPVLDQFNTFTPKEGDHMLRILPPTWADPDHFGLEVFVHYGVGPDNQTYLCLENMKGEDCPMCKEKREAEAEGQSEYAKELSATKRVAVWFIDREREEDGPILWLMPWTIDRDLANLMIDKRSGEIFQIHQPENGYDIEFTRQGSKEKTKYIGLQIARRSSPLSDDPDLADEWLDFVEENPIPDCLNYFDYAYIEDVFRGSTSIRSDEAEEEAAEKEEDTGRKDQHSDEEKEGSEEEKGEDGFPSEDDIEGMVEDELLEVADTFGLDVDLSKATSIRRKRRMLNDAIEDFEETQNQPEPEPDPEPDPEPEKKTDVKSKFRKMRKKAGRARLES